MENTQSQVLLVDDYDINLEILEAYLSRSSMNLIIYKASNGLEAIDIVHKHDIDLILLDVMLPDINGYEVCKRLKSLPQFELIPIIMITALHDKQSMLEGLQSGADEFLTKPVDGHELMIRVNNLLKLRLVTNKLNLRYQQIQKELSLAHELQKSFLPKQTPNISGLDFEMIYKPSGYIGGDFYDFLAIDEHRVGVFISDVKGHGVASAMITATLKDNLYKLSKVWDNPQELFMHLNKQLYQFFSNTANDYFVTAFYGIIDQQRQQMIYSNAGHTTPYLANCTQLTFLDTETGIPLGIFEESFFENVTIKTQSQDEIFMFTDGLFELGLLGQTPGGKLSLEEFFEENMTLNINHLSILKKAIKQFVSENTLPDDVNYISIKIN